MLVLYLVLSMWVRLGLSSQYCDLLIAFDAPLWSHLGQSMESALVMAKSHVAFANEIFVAQIFNDDHGLADLRFRVKRVMVVYESCKGLPSDGWKNCTQVREEFLSNFESKGFGSDFCLSYLFTYLDFHNGTAGLASVGTVCRPSFNSGFITLLNFGANRTEEESKLTFVHELGHSLGAHHDEDTDDEQCKSSNFIMAEVVRQELEYVPKFSSCSIRAMVESLRSLINGHNLCFHNDDDDVEVSLCGNYQVDAGEECDCGLHYEQCNDPCCYSGHIHPYDRILNASALQCSTNLRPECLTPSFIFYGLKMPPLLLLLIIGGTYLVLNYDWRRRKMLFGHLNHNNNNNIVVVNND